MATWLRQSTAVDIAFGPFLDNADGNTTETGLTITQPDIRLKKNGAAWAQKNAAQTLSHEENGWYEIALDTTDTNTLGILIVAVHESGALPVWREFMVVSQQVWDSFFSTDVLQVDVTQILGAAVSTSTAQLGVNAVQAGGTAWGSGAITAASIATGAIDADALAADAVTEIAAGITVPSAASIADAVWDEVAADHQTLNTFGQALGDPDGNGDSLYVIASNLPPAAAIWSQPVDGAVTAEQSLRLANSALGGLLSGAGTGTETVRDLADTKDRLVYTVDTDGNRSAVTTDLT